MALNGIGLALVLLLLLAASASLFLEAKNVNPSYVPVYKFNLTRVVRHRLHPHTLSRHHYNRPSGDLSVINDAGLCVPYQSVK
jgi:hypothetical protein